MAAFPKVRDAEVADLQKELQASEQCATTQHLIRDFHEKGVPGLAFC